MKVRTRFAPSPTGFLHVGSVRTALYCWLYAKKTQGTFVLRIEDTDRERSTQANVDAIFEGMEWLGLTYDEGPFYQTKRFDRYLEVAEQLLQAGKAYRCYCTKERLDSLRQKQQSEKQKPRYDGCCRSVTEPTDPKAPFVIRFKNPEEGTVVIQDMIHGDIKINNIELDDLIIVRSDGTPTYNFTVVIDDWDMKITHVIRGDDHINNTPRQINIFNALGAPLPVFAHMPMILGSDGKRLSKRHGAVSVQQYRDDGILPEALINYLLRLGWSHGDQEIFSKQEMIEHFSLENINKSAAAFDTEKLLWLNQHYLVHGNRDNALDELRQQFETLGVHIPENPEPSLEQLWTVQGNRAKTLKEMAEKSLFFFQGSITIDEKSKSLLTADACELIRLLKTAFESTDNWQAEEIKTVINRIATEQQVKFPEIAKPLRVMVTGSTSSPSIDVTLELIGKKRVMQRITAAIGV